MGGTAILVVTGTQRLDADLTATAADLGIRLDTAPNRHEAARAMLQHDYSAVFSDPSLLSVQTLQSLVASSDPADETIDGERLIDIVAHRMEGCLAFLDCDFNLTWMNDAYADRFGSPREFLLGRNHFDLFPRSDNRATFERVRATGESCEVKESANGSDSKWSLTLTPVRDEGGELQGFALSGADAARDVDARREVERLRTVEQAQRDELTAKSRMLDEERLRLKSVLEHMPAGVFLVDSATCEALFANERTWSILRERYAIHGEEGPPGRHYGVHPDGRVYEMLDWPVWRSALRGEEVKDEETRVILGDGSEGYLSISSTPLRDPDGAITGAVVMFNDVTERRRAEVARKEVEDRLRLALNAAHMIGWSWDPATDAMSLTGEVEDMLGVPIHHAREFLNMLRPEDTDRLRAAVARAFAHRREFELMFEWRRPGTWESRWIVLRGSSMLNPAGGRESVAGVVLDVTDRMRIDQDHAERLRRQKVLLEVSEGILAETTVDGLLQHTADAARTIARSEISVCEYDLRNGRFLWRVTSSRPDAHEQGRARYWKGYSGAYAQIIREGVTVRYGEDAPEADPSGGGRPVVRGVIGAPMFGRDGSVMGVLMASDRECGEFSEEDEALLGQLALIASLGLQHVEARREAERRAAEAEEGRRLLDALMENVPEAISIVAADDLNDHRTSRFADDLVRSRFGDGCSAADVWRRFQLMEEDGKTPLGPGMHPLVRAVRLGEAVTNQEVVIHGPNGLVITALCNCAPIADQDGKITAGVLAWRDISTLKAAREVLEQAYRRERHIAEVFQDALITKVDLDLPRYTIAARYQPALNEAEVGGDFYDAFELSDGRLAVVMGDISGKGLQAAVYTAMVKYCLRAYALEDPEPTAVMTKLNAAVYAHTKDEIFVTLFYATLDRESGVMTYANGGHDEPLLYLAESERVVPLHITGRAVGMTRTAQYGQRAHQFSSGDTLLVYTDGITDARSHGRFYGIEGLTALLMEHCRLDAHDLIETVFSSARAFAGGHLRDDTAALVLRMK